MKKGIHPEYQSSKIVCVCGSVIQTRSTLKEIRVEICSNCHPFFTGKQKLIDSAGRVDRFRRRYAGSDAGVAAAAAAASEAKSGEAKSADAKGAKG